VEDDDSVRRSLRRLLTVHGYDVYEASSHSTALDGARLHRPQVMIVDLHLPGLSGLHIARSIRADPSVGALSLIAFSASVPDWDEDLQHFDCVVEKPARAEVLLKAVADSVRLREECATIRTCTRVTI
jgi:CheY-like chemotaxis protein